MSLPVPNLDDRTFQDLVDEAKRLIPTYCPEWTNHNLTDPGVALIELFAWMTELSLFRLNQVPDKFYTHMLNMIGFEPFPATAARTDLTFWLVDVVDEPVVVPAGTQVSTAGDIGAPRVFTTLTDLDDHPARADGRARVARARRLRRRVGRAAPARTRPSSASRARRPRPGDRFYLGFERPLAGNAIRMTIAANVEGIGVIPTKPPLRWEVWQGSGLDPGHRVPRHHRRAQPRRPDHAARPAGPRAADARRPAGVLAAGPGARARARASRRTARRRRSARSASTRSAGR